MAPPVGCDPQSVGVGRWIVAAPAGRPPARSAGLVFFPGGLVDPVAYAPIARAVAQRGHPAVLVQLPRRGAFGGTDGLEPFNRARAAMNEMGARRCVVAGHSRGVLVASRMALATPAAIQGLVLVGSSHPRDFSLAHLSMPVTRVYGTRDTVADVEKLEATRSNLPPSTRWVRIDGGNHSQFGWYGFQPGDWPATITREQQQAITVDAIVAMLRAVSPVGHQWP